MSKYPSWWDKTITVYNKHVDTNTQVVSWTRNVVHNCFWKDTGNKVTIGNTTLETDNVVLRIPQQENFLPQYEWKILPSDERADYFTLGIGDIIVAYEVDDVINEYQSGYRSTDLIKKYKNLQGCVEIQKVALDISTGMVNPYYYVTGI